MSDNQKQNSDNQAGLKLLRDIFRAACLFNPYFPATLQDDCEPLEEECDVETCNEECCDECCKGACTEDCDECCDEHCEERCFKNCERCSKRCNNDCCDMCHEGKDIHEDKKMELLEGNVFKFCDTSFRYTNDGLIYEIYYSGIDKRVADDHDLFMKWYIKIYEDHFLTAYKINLNEDDRKRGDNTDCVTRISFEFYAEDDKYNNLALTPWYWDNDMLTFFYKDEDGDKHYVRYFNNEGQISICKNEDGIIVTDIISDADREMFITTLKKGINDNLSSCNENNDNLSCDSEDLCSGTDFDNNIEDVFDSMPDEEVQDECEDTFCDVEEDEYLEEECDFTGSEETIGDVVRSYGFNVRGQSVRDKNDKHSYAPVVKEAYKDIMYKEYEDFKARGMTLSNEEIITLFDYMLKNKLYDYCAYGTKIIISVSYEDMMYNINITKPLYSTPCVASSSNLPWFMASDNSFKRIPISWEELNKQIFVENIRRHYHFDEVILIDMPGTDEEPYLKEKHCILCAFDAM